VSTTLTSLIQTIEAKLTAAPSLGVTVSDDLSGVRSATRQHQSLLVWRESTRERDLTRNQFDQMVEDSVRVDLWSKVKPKDQRTSRDTAYDLSTSLRNRLTDLADVDMRRWGVTLTDERERREGEWLVIEHTFRVRRKRTIGQG